MKAATGELSLTVITVVLIGFILGGFYLFWPKIKDTISRQWDDNVNGQAGEHGHGTTFEDYE